MGSYTSSFAACLSPHIFMYCDHLSKPKHLDFPHPYEWHGNIGWNRMDVSQFIQGVSFNKVQENLSVLIIKLELEKAFTI